MHKGPNTPAPAARGVLARLRGDVRGNVLAMMAMFLIPLTGLVGSAVDMSRLYVVKARLQQACDAGALAGRKFMADTGSTLDAPAELKAQTFFTNNFKKDTAAAGATPATKGFMYTDTVVFTPRRTADNQVAADASASVPMTIAKIFGTNAITVSVQCQARLDVADTDIMFVLDTTGSMACLPADNDTDCADYAGSATKVEYTRTSASGGVAGYAGTKGVGTTEKSGSRIEALRQAVLSFYDTFAANADTTTRVRYGFVTYSSSVNVGQAILDKSSSYLVGGSASETQNYQSRQVTTATTYDYNITTGTVTNNNNGKSSASCTATSRSPTTARTYNSASGTATRTYDFWTGSLCQTRTDTVGPIWQYLQRAIDVNALVQGNSITDPTKVHGQTTQWTGCVETPVDAPGQSSFTTTSLPSELNPDLKPSGNTRWSPHMADFTYARNGWNDAGNDSSNGDNAYNNPNYGVDPYVSTVSFTYNGNLYTFKNTYLRDAGAVSCGKPVKRLGIMTRSEVSSYVSANDFVPMGGTYHDTGMIWGTRLIAPEGAWGGDTLARPNRNLNRVIIFLTDGDMAPSATAYSMYGIEAFDKRVAGTSTTSLTTLHNNRFLAECNAAKARNIDIWTVSIDSAANAELTTCAKDKSQALFTTKAGGDDGLSATFAKIAKRLALLRLTK